MQCNELVEMLKSPLFLERVELSIIFLFACKEISEEETTSVYEAITIGKGIQDTHEDFIEKVNKSDGAFNESIKSINHQLENRGKGFEEFEIDSSMTKGNFIIEEY